MNALYVTVSVIPIILVFAGLNHAHGLTTFGKNTNQGQNPIPQTNVKPINCTSQANCTLIKGTTCIKSFCLCGDNSHPANGKCNAKYKGPKHICTNDEECVENAVCAESTDKKTINNLLTNGNNNNNAPILICQCLDGLFAIGSVCSGAAVNTALPGLMIFVAVLAKIY
ncbi:unnamed protein product [Phyllotreta striolata]|uniref:Uncharacterized protein n=1 Tax=Phyllotreta striolata TaxID=444603 RepID=A0A9N9XKG5_PHYSR|nr:unnamed protein product [Phyllotreta striolata]